VSANLPPEPSESKQSTFGGLHDFLGKVDQLIAGVLDDTAPLQIHVLELQRCNCPVPCAGQQRDSDRSPIATPNLALNRHGPDRVNDLADRRHPRFPLVGPGESVYEGAGP